MLFNKPVSKKFLAILLLITLIVAPIIGIAVDRYVLLQTHMVVLNDALTKVFQNYAGEIDIEKFIEGAIHGAIQTLEDPYTTYLNADQYRSFMGQVDMNLVGVGLFLEKINEHIVVVRPIPDTPAYRAGLKPDDRIILINGESTAGMLLEQVVSKIRGQQGTRLNLTIQRGQEVFTVELTRTRINVPTVITNWHNGIAHFEIITFGESTTAEFRNAMTELTSRYGKIDGMIIDVRNNSGGRLQTVIDIANILLENKVVLTIVDKDQKRTSYATGALGLTIPTVVLTNHLSASASEILAGALQDHGVSKIIGTKTYGKGSVQDLVPVTGGGYVKVTTAEYLTPMGKKVNGVGITPDYHVEYPIAQLVRAINLLKPIPNKTVQIQVGERTVNVMGHRTTIDVAPFMQGNVVYVPYRFIVESMGGTLFWSNTTNSTEITWNGQRLNFDLIKMAHPMIKRGDRTYISLTDLERIFGIKSTYNPVEKVWNLTK